MILMATNNAFAPTPTQRIVEKLLVSLPKRYESKIFLLKTLRIYQKLVLQN